jgi:hypothetical protein
VSLLDSGVNDEIGPDLPRLPRLRVLLWATATAYRNLHLVDQGTELGE